MPLIRLANVAIAYGSHALLNSEAFQLERGERVGLLGRNGAGKSTLMNIIAGHVLPDSGEVWRQPGLKLAVLEQVPNLPEEDTIYDAVADGLGNLKTLITRYHQLSSGSAGTEPDALRELGELQQQLEAAQGWHSHARIETTLSKLALPADRKIKDLSGGWQRRVALARALVVDPDVLLLDEPTNHLDLDSIGWLEDLLLKFTGAVLFVTHDRAFLQKVATRIVDLDRGNLVSWQGAYEDYLRRKAATLEDEANQNAEFDKKLAQEETWIRQGIKARRTRNEGRVRALEQLRRERAQRRTLQGKSKLALANAEVSGKKVIEINNLSFSYGDKTIIKEFSVLIQRGDKIGVIGANGTGKTTLLKLLLKDLQPQSGQVIHGTRLEITYFDQLRATLDPNMTVAASIADGNDFLEINGTKRHVISYLSDFLFAQARARSPVLSLSGGEVSRLLLARLFIKPANLLVMDEPTNDLDLETLELLEAKLVEYTGTLLLVSHDRAFLDNVVTSVLVLDGTGKVEEFVGGYSDWQRQQQNLAKAENLKQSRDDKAKSKPNQNAQSNEAKQGRKKLSFKEQQELSNLPERINQLEIRQVELNQTINQPDFYKKDQALIANTLAELAVADAELEQAYQRWEELEYLQMG